ncbi:hypothetical protein T261_5814 [Streptomyces lydicus]|nr:hypothetical protein T261_5814 [Streptomyces lydicus]
MVTIPGDHFRDIDEQHEEPRCGEGLIPVWGTVPARTSDEAAERYEEFFWEFQADNL